MMGEQMYVVECRSNGSRTIPMSLDSAVRSVESFNAESPSCEGHKMYKVTDAQETGK